jgi:hypothetical protein
VYPSSQKGGTIIAERVLDLAAQQECLWDPDRCRPAECLRCGARVHVHDRRYRYLRGDADVGTEVLRFRCADRSRCGATWQVLPAFLARHLWRSWSRVEEALEAPVRSAVPARTRERWKARLRSSARRLVAVLATAVDAAWSLALTASTGLEPSRLDLIERYREQRIPPVGRCLAELAEAIHRLSPGVRLM